MRFDDKGKKELMKFREYAIQRKRLGEYLLAEILIQIVEIRELLEQCDDAGDGCDDAADDTDDC